MIGVIDIGISNIGSVLNMFKYVGHEAKAISNANELEECEKIVLPGVGSFDKGMAKLFSSGLIDTLNKRVVEDKVPVLGICLGMQLMCLSSEEGRSPGLGWIDATVRDFRKSETPPKKTPHMGWNNVNIKKSIALTADIVSESRFYFVHSYYVDCNNSTDAFLTTNYGIDFVSAFQVENIMGVQFHPEKSHIFGAAMFRSFGSM
ncbi:imidazole glycerol phosphate synthase subunit HisH [Shewanella sedimentimangrovi]|uniref:Imidazole glycerol phosphate synthase subunit HisH n=1 Tax=Shewanella sedimentimangrovi TaxID=2814293 RepID=A0ABX7QX11_9GAMM|nr:imidazole glycerol phosphate synthase subunit HisH [Shewanella sedimentimangrovi]QSX36033.1 imidazole glycerol phosphate synthase subunit HisH [Shewanella sedimentimangrovi]